MWGDALDLLDRAERMHRQFFQPLAHITGRRPGWEPPVDVFETDRELIILIALPGVAAADISVGFDGKVLSVVGERALPSKDAAVIRRMEIPHGRFERRIDLGGRVLELVREELANGCLALRFSKRV